MALGAFLAGLLLAETEYRKAIEATVAPFKGLLLGIFFFTVGMNVDVRELLHEPLWLLGGVVSLIAVKSLVPIGLGQAVSACRGRSRSRPACCSVPGGEFAFVGIGMASAAGLIEAAPRELHARCDLRHHGADAAAVVRRAVARGAADPRESRRSGTGRPACGAGSSTQSSSAMAASAKSCARCCGSTAFPISSPIPMRSTVTRDRRDGHDVYYGDAADPRFLESCGLAKAAGVIITIHSARQIDEVVAHVRAMRPDILIVSRARDADHARHLYAPRRHRRRSGDNRGEPPALRGGAGRDWAWPPGWRSPRSTRSATRSGGPCRRRRAKPGATKFMR